MPEQHARAISKRTVDALPADGKDALYWDRDLPGFGIRVYASGRKAYIVQCRGPKGSRRVTIGRHGAVAPDHARKKAAVIIDRIKCGEDPAPEPPRPEPTVADLAARYLAGHVEVNCKAASLASYRQLLDKHILPALRTMPIRSVEPAHITTFHYALRATPVTANRAIDILHKMFSLAEAWELRPAGTNPCRSVRRYKEEKRERFLTPAEVRRLGRVLDAAEAEGGTKAYAVAAIRLMMLTGCRKAEILTLRWDDLDRTAREFRLRDSKIGPRSVPLTPHGHRCAREHPPCSGQPLGDCRRQAGHPSVEHP